MTGNPLKLIRMGSRCRLGSSAVEQGNHNPLVGGSNPSRATKTVNGLMETLQTAAIGKGGALELVVANAGGNLWCIVAIY